jgi:hypothetical protein
MPRTSTSSAVAPTSVGALNSLQQELAQRLERVEGVTSVEVDGEVVRVYVPSLFDPVAREVAGVDLQFCRDHPGARVPLEIEGLQQLGESAGGAKRAA